MRLDQYLVHHGYVETRSKATDLIKRGLVKVNDQPAKKAGQEIIDEHVELLINDQFVGRGGEKLAGAIKTFQLDFKDKVVIDVGASTGGFTDVSLRYGASHVFAYDVGSNQMVDSLKQDERVSVFEQTNFLDVTLPDADIIVIDVSFISITAILKHIKGFKGLVIGLVKPQFEAGHTHMKHGVLKDVKKHKNILESVISYANHIGLFVFDIMASTIKGKKGNQEYMIIMNGSLNEPINQTRKIEELTC